MSACARGAPLRSLDNMPNDKSTEIGRYPAFARSMHKSPVPEAKSRTNDPGASDSARTAFFRQRTSSRKVMMRFTRSYRGAMASNIDCTMTAFCSPSGSESESQMGLSDLSCFTRSSFTEVDVAARDGLCATGKAKACGRIRGRRIRYFPSLHSRMGRLQTS